MAQQALRNHVLSLHALTKTPLYSPGRRPVVKPAMIHIEPAAQTTAASSLSGERTQERRVEPPIMADPATIERVEALAGAARHIREHYGDRLAELYVLPEQPYPDGDDGDGEIAELHLVAILNLPVDVFDEFDFTATLTGLLFEQYGFFVITHVAKPASELAALTRADGVRL